MEEIWEKAGIVILMMVFTVTFLFGLFGASIGKKKNAAKAGFWCGFLLGPIGWIIAALALDNRPLCPRCLSRVHENATVCPFCRSVLSKAPGMEQEPEQKPSRQTTFSGKTDAGKMLDRSFLNSSGKH